MSYKTNPITNRFNINKGWKNANFPENLSFYARDNVFFFKLNLFLKAYFALRNIKLISCQIRVAEDHVPILYLIINTTTRRKKKRSTSTFMNLWPTKRAGFKYSPLRNPWNAEALTLMFLDLPKLKKVLNTQFLPVSKQKPSLFWLTKPRMKTWLNFVTKVRQRRTKLIRSQNITNFNPTQVKIFKYKVQSSLRFKLSRTMKEFLLLTKILKVLKNNGNLTRQTLTFYKQRLKTMSQDIQTMNSVLSKIQKRQTLQKKRKLSLYREQRTKNLIIKFQQKQLKFFHQRLQKSRFYESNLFLLKLHTFKKNTISPKIWRSKKFQKSKFLKSRANQKPVALTRNHKDFKKLILDLLTVRLKLDQFSQRKKSTVFNLIEINQKLRTPYKKSARKIVLTKSSIQRKNGANKLIHHLFNQKPILKPKKKVMPFLLHQYQQLRTKKKKTLSDLDRTKISSEMLKKYHFNKKVEAQAHQINLEDVTSVLEEIPEVNSEDEDPQLEKNRTRTYRQSFRMSYKKHLNLLVRYQYKLWIQKVLQIFFQTRFEVKFTQPLTQFKNLKFLRLVYPVPYFRQQPKIQLTTSKQNLYSAEEKFIGKRYVYLGKNLKRLNLLENQPHSAKFNLNTYSFQKKADIFKRWRRKKLRDYAQKRLGSIKNKLLMREFVPTLSLFIKYLNPQILADHIAKEFEKTKKHRNIIFALKTALRSLKFARGIGYRIAIVGRINSSTKSRAFYLTKKSLIRQNFSQKINYATAQAKARIGSFGIKVWLFY